MTTHPLLLIITFGLATLLLGGYLGGEMTRRQQVKEDIKALQAEHAATLARIDSVVQQAALNEAATLAQIDSVYSILGELNAKESKTRQNIKATAVRLDQMKKSASQAQTEILNAASDSEITLRKKSSN